MAYLLKRGHVFHLCHCVTPDRKRVRFSTGLRDDVPGHVRQANAIRDQYTAQESAAAVNVPRYRAVEQWGKWVEEWAAMKYPNKGTLKRWRSMWRTLKIFFEEKKIHTPRDLTGQHCFEYFKWRITPENETKEAAAIRKKKGLHPATHNTALLEMQALGVIMKEAVRRAFSPTNPCRELGFGRLEEKKPVELDDALLAAIEAKIQETSEPQRTILWRSYMIARKHGVRLSETQVNPMRDVLLKEPHTSEITFYQKGGRKRVKPLHPDLFQMFKELRDAGATETFKEPANFASFWWGYISRWGLQAEHGKVCFHSLRVTVQNKLRRAGVNEEIRKAYLSHETKDSVHQGYSRIKLDELRVCHPHL